MGVPGGRAAHRRPALKEDLSASREAVVYGFARRDAEHGPLLLFTGEEDDIAQATGPAHPQWGEAVRLGMDELHLHFPVPRRVDRLQLLSRVVRRTQPLLNCLEEAHAPAASAELARLWA